MNLPYHIHIHARPPQVAMGEVLQLNGDEVQTLEVSPADLTVPLPTTFDQALTNLESIERLFIEPDGSFVWPGGAWQLDGNLYDRGDRLHYVDAKGNCAGQQLADFFTALAGDSDLMIQLVREAVFISADEFRRMCDQPT